LAAGTAYISLTSSEGIGVKEAEGEPKLKEAAEGDVKPTRREPLPPTDLRPAVEERRLAETVGVGVGVGVRTK